jgi:pilus assembly protein CpaB
MRVILVILMVAGLSLAGWVGWGALHAPHPAQAAAALPAAPPAHLIVSAEILHAGSLIRPSDLQAHDFPADAVVPGALVDSAAERARLVGALLRTGIPAGGVLLSSELVFPGDHGYLAAVLSPGTRAVTVGVDEVSGNAGLIWPGDRVDLILTQTMGDTNQATNSRMVAETVLGGVRVIAADKALVRGEQPANEETLTRTITLEATPQQAERIAVASRMGKLSLTLCALQDTESAADRPAPRPVWSGDISPALAAAPKARGQATVHLFEGAEDQKEIRF